MTAKNKAEELVKKYLSIENALNVVDLPYMTFTKQCALIAVDELIRIAPWGSDIDGEIEDDSKEYYIKVKNEIEKL